MGAERVRQAIGQTTIGTDSGGKLTVTVSAAACTTDHASHNAEPSIVWPTRRYIRSGSRVATWWSSQDRGHPSPIGCPRDPTADQAGETAGQRMDGSSEGTNERGGFHRDSLVGQLFFPIEILFSPT